MNTSDLQLMDAHIDALFTHDPNRRIRAVNEPGGDPAPRFFLGRTRQGNRWRYRYDLPDEVVRKLEKLAAKEPVQNDLRATPRNLEAFQEALGDEMDTPPASFGPAYRFPDALSEPTTVTQVTHSNLDLLQRMSASLEDLAQVFEAREPVWAMIEDGYAVSVCYSSRLTERAAEAGVETLETYRGRGYATAVVAAWAHTVRVTGRIPFYDTSWENAASRALARKLGLIQYGADLSL